MANSSVTLTIQAVDGGNSLSDSTTLGGSADDALEKLEVTVADTTDTEITISIDFSALIFFMAVADQAMTLESNDTSTPDNTVTLAANVPVVWYTGCDHLNPFADADVTSLFAYQTSGSSATLKIWRLHNATP